MIFVDASEDQIGFGVSSIGGSDVNIFFSGSQGSKVDPDSGQTGNGDKGTAVFGGDLVISGTLYGGSPLKIGGPIQFQNSTDAEASAQSPPDGDTFSLTNLLSGSGAPTMGSGTPFTAGVRFIPLRARTITGVRFWANYSSDQFVTVKLWYDGNDVAEATEEVLGGSIIHEVLFDTAYTIPTDLIGKRFIVSLYDVAETEEYPYSTNAGDMPTPPFVADPHYIIQKADIYGNGDSFPESDSTEYYMIHPIFQKITYTS